MIVDLLNSVARSPYWIAAGWTMLHFLWIGLAIAAAILILLRSIDRARPEIRHAAVLLGFAVLVAAPVPIYRSLLAQIQTAPAIADARSVDSATSWVGLPPRDSAQTEVTTGLPTAVPRSGRLLETVARWMPVVWAAGVPYTLAMLAAGLLGAHRLRQHGAPLIDGPHKASLDRLRRLMGIRRHVALALFDGVRAPVLLGLLKPVILLPAALLTDLTPQQLELLLIHELAHVRRWDNLVNLLQRLAEGVLFFHPAVWVISRRLRLERELCCDAIVLRYANRPRMYVLTLASLAAPAAALRCAPAAMANHQLLSRVRRILNPEQPAMRTSRNALGLGLGAGLAAFMLLAGIAVALAADEKDQAQAPKPQPPANALAGEPIPPPAEGANGSSAAAPTPAPSARAVSTDEVVRTYGAKVALQRASRRPVVAAAPALRSYGTRSNTNAAAAMLDLIDGDIAPPRNGAQQLDRAWGPEQATGEPNVPAAADDGHAWASLSPDSQDEWLELRYTAPVEATKILIYESYNPGAVSEVIVTDDKGVNYRAFKGPDPSRGSDMAVLIVSLAKPVSIVTVRIELASTKVPGWNEIDAVGLVDHKTEKVSWADSARASTTYAEPQPIRPAPPRISDAELEKLRKENQELRRALEAQKASRPI